MKPQPASQPSGDLPEVAEQGEILGECIRRRRQRLGLTQEQLAKAAGLSRTELHYIEKAMRRPKFDTVLRCCVGLGINALELLAEVDRRQTARRLARLGGC
jgi:transcriptional regulator with XRE-family HTH domain